MRAGVHVICRPETALGVALAGVSPIEARTASDAALALSALAAEPAHGGIVLVEQPLHDALPGPLLRQIRKDGAPIVMPFPGPAPLRAGTAPDDELLEVLRRAIGYRMRLR